MIVIKMGDIVIEIGEDIKDGVYDWAYYGRLIPVMIVNVTFYVMFFWDMANKYQSMLGEKIEF